MGFLEDLAKNAALWGAVEASKDASGKPDPYKAAGMAAGMGNFSPSDRARLGAMLGSQGAFDDDFYSDDFDDGDLDDDLDDDDFDDDDSDEDWKLFCEDGLEYGLDPDDYETEEEYNEAVDSYVARREQYVWRKIYRRQNTYGLNIYEYETEREFLQALVVAKEEFLEVARNDKTIYHYCGVVYKDNPYPYHYRTNDTTLKIGDKVVVPVGSKNEEVVAEIVSVEQHTRLTVPYPVEKVKFILRKYGE